MNFSTSRVRNGSLTLNYVEWGRADRPTLVLLHGLRAYAHWFDDFAAAAAERYRVVSLDQRGRGASDWAADKKYNTDAYVSDIGCLVDALDVERITLIGHSMGGTNAVNYAAAAPERVAALVIVDSAPELAPEGLQRIRGELGHTPSGFADRDEARQFLRGLHARASAESLETRLDWMLVPDASGRLAWRIDPAIFDPNMTPDQPARMWSALAQIACPTLIVRGALSDIVTEECVGRMVAALPVGEAVEIPDAAHMICEDNPPAFNAAVLPFLDRVLAPA